jgi:DNA-binding transcriptional regulator YhcF (GntR family)
MKIWISKNSEVSVREQIVTQVTVGLATGDLAPGERLPSTRELARRFGVHPNTVAGAYRELASARVVTVKKGSGIYAARDSAPAAGNPGLEPMFDALLANALAAGFERGEILAALRKWMAASGPKRIVLVEPDPQLRRILSFEIEQALGVEPVSAETAVPQRGHEWKGCVIAALSDEEERLAPSLGPSAKTVFLKFNFVTSSLGRADRPSENELIAVVSGWGSFVSFAKIYLTAAGIDPARLITRSVEDKNWRAGLSSAGLVICDRFTASLLHSHPHKKVFDLISPESIEALRHAVE